MSTVGRPVAGGSQDLPCRGGGWEPVERELILPVDELVNATGRGCGQVRSTVEEPALPNRSLLDHLAVYQTDQPPDGVREAPPMIQIESGSGAAKTDSGQKSLVPSGVAAASGSVIETACRSSE